MRRTAAATMIAALALAGCQQAGDTSGEPTTSPTTPAAQAPTEADEPTGTDGATGTDQPTGTDGATGTDQPTGTDGATGTGEPTGTDEPTDGGTPTEEPTEETAAADLPPFVGADDQVEQRPEAGTVEAGQEIVDVRVAGHDGFDRVVLDLSGDDPLLGWLGQYQDEALESGSGAPIEVEGSAVLSVPVVGIDWTTGSPDRYDGQAVVGGDTQNVTEVVLGILFEGEQQVFVGVQERTPYRVFALADPARIVIDVEHP